MGALVTSFEDALLNLLFRNQDITGVGDAGGLRGSVTAGSWYISACIAWPGEAPSQNTSEATYTGYVRAAVARSTGAWNAPSNGTISPVSSILWGKRTDNGAAQDIMFLVLGDSSSGAGTARIWGALGDAAFAARPFVCNSTASDTLYIPGHGLAAGDRIAFFNYEAFADLPAGLTEGTVYFVRTTGLTTDQFTVSTTGAGGTAVDITTLGGGYAIKIIPIPVTQGIEPALLSSAFVRLS